MIERYRFKKDECYIEIEAPKEKAIAFINKYYSDFELVEN